MTNLIIDIENRSNSAKIVAITFSSFLPWEPEFKFEFFLKNWNHVNILYWLLIFCPGCQINDHNPTLILLWLYIFKPTSAEFLLTIIYFWKGLYCLKLALSLSFWSISIIWCILTWASIALYLVSAWLDLMWPIWIAAFSMQLSRSAKPILFVSAIVRTSLSLLAKVWMEVLD